MNLETIIEDFEFFDDWEDRYKYIMDLGKSLDPLSDDDYGKTNKVDGCASQVWLIINEQPSIEALQGGLVIIITIAIHSFLKLKKS